MIEILYLLLPLAFYSGWKAAKKNTIRQYIKSNKLADDYVKGVNYLLSEKPDKALEVFINHPDVDEYTAETYLLLGNMFRNRGEVDRALRVHQNLISRPSLNSEQKQKAMFSLGKDFFAAGPIVSTTFSYLLKEAEVEQAIGVRPFLTHLWGENNRSGTVAGVSLEYLVRF